MIPSELFGFERRESCLNMSFELWSYKIPSFFSFLALASVVHNDRVKYKWDGERPTNLFVGFVLFARLLD